MLALKGYEKTNGFSVLNTDELFFINGGSNQFGKGPETPSGPSTAQQIGAFLQQTGQDMVNVGAVATGVAQATPIPIDDAGMGIWNAVGAGLQIVGGWMNR